MRDGVLAGLGFADDLEAVGGFHDHAGGYPEWLLVIDDEHANDHFDFFTYRKPLTYGAGGGSDASTTLRGCSAGLVSDRRRAEICRNALLEHEPRIQVEVLGERSPGLLDGREARASTERPTRPPAGYPG